MLAQERLDFVDNINPTKEEHQIREYAVKLVQTTTVRTLWSYVGAVVFGSFDAMLYHLTSDFDIESVAGIPVDISFNVTNCSNSDHLGIREIPGLQLMDMLVKYLLIIKVNSWERITTRIKVECPYTAVVRILHFLPMHFRIQTNSIDPMDILSVLLVEFLELYDLRFNKSRPHCVTMLRNGYLGNDDSANSRFSFFSVIREAFVEAYGAHRLTGSDSIEPGIMSTVGENAEDHQEKPDTVFPPRYRSSEGVRYHILNPTPEHQELATSINSALGTATAAYASFNQRVGWNDRIIAYMENHRGSSEVENVVEPINNCKVRLGGVLFGFETSDDEDKTLEKSRDHQKGATNSRVDSPEQCHGEVDERPMDEDDQDRGSFVTMLHLSIRYADQELDGWMSFAINCYKDQWPSLFTINDTPVMRSDLDIVLPWERRPQGSNSIQIISKAGVPLIKFRSLIAGIPVSVSFNITNGIDNM
ncbi:MAG: hypothetical protein J3Q66DRAFT_399781 [Benniella sp.]|nr:MAG: hypothetical protein J3Q66DRAFT_399781 [Benniella sp.]